MTTITAKDWPEVERLIMSGAIPTFRTKKDAIAAGSDFGCKKAIRFARRFETVWLVGFKHFQDSYEGDLQFSVVQIYLLNWKNGLSQSIKARQYVGRVAA